MPKQPNPATFIPREWSDAVYLYNHHDLTHSIVNARAHALGAKAMYYMWNHRGEQLSATQDEIAQVSPGSA